MTARSGLGSNRRSVFCADEGSLECIVLQRFVPAPAQTRSLREVVPGLPGFSPQMVSVVVCLLQGLIAPFPSQGFQGNVENLCLLR